MSKEPTTFLDEVGGLIKEIIILRKFRSENNTVLVLTTFEDIPSTLVYDDVSEENIDLMKRMVKDRSIVLHDLKGFLKPIVQ